MRRPPSAYCGLGGAGALVVVLGMERGEGGRGRREGKEGYGEGERGGEYWEEKGKWEYAEGQGEDGERTEDAETYQRTNSHPRSDRGDRPRTYIASQAAASSEDGEDEGRGGVALGVGGRED